MTEGVVAGIDWASEVHVACVLGEDGAVAGRFSFTHDAAAIRAMVRRLRSAGVAGVAIERGDGPVAEELLAAGLAVFVVPSRRALQADGPPRRSVARRCAGSALVPGYSPVPPAITAAIPAVRHQPPGIAAVRLVDRRLAAGRRSAVAWLLVLPGCAATAAVVRI